MEKLPKSNQYRFEKKYKLELDKIEDFISSILSKGCTPIFHKRYINNVYFDDYAMSAFQENIEGLSNREKTRFRWYGDQFGEIKVTAEKKIKVDDVNKKKSAKLGKFKLNSFNELDKLSHDFTEAIVNNAADDFIDIVNLKPSLVNRYAREYFINDIENIRITIDTELSYYNHANKECAVEDEFAIIEVKTAKETPIINNLIPLVLGKSSKYCDGIIKTNSLIEF